MPTSSHFIHVVAVLFLRYLLVTAGTNISTDQSALLALKTSITSDPYGILENWTISSSVCNWIGVTCGARHRRITVLNVSSMSLTGTVPPEFGNLSFLVSLDMRSNLFSGTLPSDLVRLRRLRFIRLSYNGFTGEVPLLFGFLPRLELLSLRNNSFTGLSLFLGSFSNGTELHTLDVGFNSVRGELPESISNLRNLKAFSLEGNHVSGSIPSSLANMSSLETLILSQNSIQGIIPEGIGNLHNLKWLNMENNRLTGSIPFGIFNISTLELVSFGENSLSGLLPNDMCLQVPSLEGIYLSFNEIHGRIPSNISACSQLQTLSLSNNYFTGTIPPEIVNLEMLNILYLGFNKLTGLIPSEIGKLRNLQFFALENNLLTGSIPSSLFNITSFQRLSLAQNKLEGILTEEFGNLTTLTELYLGHNHFTGVIPQRFSELKGLAVLDLGTNELSGPIPSDVFNISTLILISLTGNSLSGKLPSNIGYLLPNLGMFYLGGNNFDGVLPNSISNCSELTNIDLSGNKFTGPIPDSLGNLRSLQVLNLEDNNFTSKPVSPELSFLNSLTNCRYLTELAISYNPLGVILPSSVGNLSSSLLTVYASDCKISGHIPNEIGNLSGLATLYLYGNELSGFIPETLDGLSNLQRISLGSNRIRGYIPSGLCKLKNLGALILSQNLLTGSIPECLGNVSSLRSINLGFNYLTSDIPASIWNLQDLLTLDISSNSFTGSLSDRMGNLKVATSIDLSVNQLSNDIPATLGELQSLAYLSLAHNRFQGSIPESMGHVLNLVSLDLSYNNISGAIPKSLEALKYLVYFNVSFNQLSGEIPTDGPFQNFTIESFMFNSGLCGSPRFQVSSCPKSKHKSKLVLRVVFILPGIAVLVSAVTLTLILIKYRRKSRLRNVSHIPSVEKHPQISYHDLLQATNGYSNDNFLGKGGFGSVYKGVLRDGTILAIKVFNMELEGALRTFDVECEVLRNLRHRNLTKVITSCSNKDFRALVLEYMPNGSLEKWLHSDGYFLNMIQRLNIMIDVASALEYLHHDYSTPVVHCDLKPSNVLIDENMVAHVSDFGIAKFLGRDESMRHTRTIATMGYMAPGNAQPCLFLLFPFIILPIICLNLSFSEYGLEGIVSTRCDVYSYGVMLLETFTRKRPSDEMFDGDFNLKKWVKDSQSNALLSQVVDADLVRLKEEPFDKKFRCVSTVLELALNCMAEAPGERINMKDVLAELKKIKLQFMSD